MSRPTEIERQIPRRSAKVMWWAFVLPAFAFNYALMPQVGVVAFFLYHLDCEETGQLVNVVIAALDGWDRSPVKKLYSTRPCMCINLKKEDWASTSFTWHIPLLTIWIKWKKKLGSVQWISHFQRYTWIIAIARILTYLAFYKWLNLYNMVCIAIIFLFVYLPRLLFS